MLLFFSEKEQVSHIYFQNETTEWARYFGNISEHLDVFMSLLNPI